jgi:hypothetical protein
VLGVGGRVSMVPAMSSSSSRPDDPPATVEQLAAAMAALGLYTGHNTPEEHAEEAERLGGRDVYRLRLANALLGGVQIEALLGETRGVTDEQRAAAHREQLLIAGVVEDPAKLLEFLRWQTLRVAGPLREIAQNDQVGPIPLAAAHTAEGLQRLLGVCAAGQNLTTIDALPDELDAAREALTTAITNIDILRNLVATVSRL